MMVCKPNTEVDDSDFSQGQPEAPSPVDLDALTDHPLEPDPLGPLKDKHRMNVLYEMQSQNNTEADIVRKKLFKCAQRSVNKNFLDKDLLDNNADAGGQGIA